MTFIDHEGVSRTVEGKVGDSLMQAAIHNRVPGIEAQCAGSMVCGTCHSYLYEPWSGAVAAPTDDERIMLSCGDHQTAHSRLACQIKITPELDGIVVHTPPSQP